MIKDIHVYEATLKAINYKSYESGIFDTAVGYLMEHTIVDHGFSFGDFRKDYECYRDM